jgi:hypothetical protein
MRVSGKLPQTKAQGMKVNVATAAGVECDEQSVVHGPQLKKKI